MGIADVLGCVKQPLVDERLEDQRHRGVGMLAPDVEQQRAQLARQVVSEATIAAWLRARAVEASGAMRIYQQRAGKPPR
ncbi:hypothetical protein WMF38_43470 [Sorangium sp. So ce118]